MKNKTQLFHLYTFRFFLSVGLFLFFSLHPFCEEKVYASSWKVTQYGSDSDFQQSMFYTIKGSNGKLIVIDGGWDYDAKRVRDTIKKLGGKVNLWIITHPHPDHVGAFNQIFANPDGMWIAKGDADVQTVQLNVTGNTITNSTNKGASGSNSNVRVAAVTGDNSPIVLLSIVLAASLAALIALFVSGIRRKNNRK